MKTNTLLLLAVLAALAWLIWSRRRERAPEGPMINVNQTARTDFGGGGGGLAGGFDPFSMLL